MRNEEDWHHFIFFLCSCLMLVLHAFVHTLVLVATVLPPAGSEAVPSTLPSHTGVAVHLPMICPSEKSRLP